MISSIISACTALVVCRQNVVATIKNICSPFIVTFFIEVVVLRFWNFACVPELRWHTTKRVTIQLPCKAAQVFWKNIIIVGSTTKFNKKIFQNPYFYFIRTRWPSYMDVKKIDQIKGFVIVKIIWLFSLFLHWWWCLILNVW